MIGRRTVGQRLALLNGVTDAHERTVVDAGGLVGALVLGQVILVHAAGVLDDNLGGVGIDDFAGVLGQGNLARVQGGATLHAGTDIGSGGVNQRHGLTLHVGAHERTLGVVVLEERNQRGCDGEHLTRRDVHVVDVLDRHVAGAPKEPSKSRVRAITVCGRTILPSASVVMNSLVLGSSGVLAGAMTCFSSSSAVIQSI